VSEPAHGLDPDWDDQLPIDPDVDVAEDRRHRAGTSAFEQGRLSPWPRLHADVIGAVFLGGCVGGYARYAVGVAWTTPLHGFPTATLTVNLLGAFALAVVIVVATDIRPSRYLRPLLGTGLCGALTTFSSVVVALAQLLAHGAYAIAAGYLAATVVGGLAAASFGLVLSRAVETSRRRSRERPRTEPHREPLAERSA
jgi:CrcB protein